MHCLQGVYSKYRCAFSFHVLQNTTVTNKSEPRVHIDKVDIGKPEQAILTAGPGAPRTP